MEPNTEKKGLFARLREGLGKTRDSFNEKLDNVFSVFTKLDDDLYDELEEALIMADIGGQTSCEIVEQLRENVKAKHYHVTFEPLFDDPGAVNLSGIGWIVIFLPV